MQKTAYRIIDANFNRSREALRVMEEFCRFVLNHKGFNSRLKDFRHILAGEISKIDQNLLLACRDTNADVGTDIKTANQLTRTSLLNVFTAACKRLPEALRAMAEIIKIENSEIAEAIEQLRYQAYTLEKDITLFADAAIRFQSVKLYVLISECEYDKICDLTRQCTQAGADCIQLRCKNNIKSDRQLLQIADDFVKICRDNKTISIINDRPDIAVLSQADGVHLGQDDIDIEQMQKLATKAMIIGKSTHNISQLKDAIAENPTYVGLGPVFSTKTKPDEPVAGLEYLTGAAEILQNTGITGVAIGGITIQNVHKVLQYGVKTVAICSEITKNNSAEKCRKFRAILSC